MCVCVCVCVCMCVCLFIRSFIGSLFWLRDTIGWLGGRCTVSVTRYTQMQALIG